jgi:uncharacterized protein YndB with AHSA1/START domain
VEDRVTPLEVIDTIHIQADPARVWAGLTDPALLDSWFGERNEIDPRAGGRMAFEWEQHGRFAAVIEEFDAGSALTFRWASVPDAEPRKGNSTVVRFTLEGSAGGTQLTVRETGWELLDADLEEVEQAMRENTEGWHEELAELAALLERQDSL